MNVWLALLFMVLGAAAALVIRDVIATVLHTGRHTDVEAAPPLDDAIVLDWSDPRPRDAA